MQQGRHDVQIIRQALLNKQPVPEKIASAPVLLPWLEPIYVAFHRLCTCRSIGMSFGPIPWTAIHQYAVTHRYDETAEELYRFETLIERMDSAYIEEVERKSNKTTQGTKRKNKRSRGKRR
jgi:hypothetical protein